MSSTKAAVYPCLFPAFVPAWLEKSSSGNYLVLARTTDFSPVSNPPVKTDHLVKPVLVWSRNVKETLCNSLRPTLGIFDPFGVKISFQT